ncbi:MAG: MBL fold metallo-hydrolase [Longicatena sp.]
MKNIETFVLGMVQVNTYVLWEDNHVLLIDPGSKSMRLQNAIDEKEGIVDGIVLTHAHFDHIAGVDALAKKYKCNVYINDIEIPLLTDPNLNFSLGEQIIVKTPPTILKRGKNTIGAFVIEAIDAPGHSEGSTMILWNENLFCGDVLFQGSIGCTDLATSSNTKMMQTLKLIKDTLDPELIVYPGHGPSTTLKTELLYNPYLQF